MNFSIRLLAALLLIAGCAHAQAPVRNVQSRTQAWVAYFNQTRFSDKFGFWLDVQQRQTDDFVSRPFVFLARPALTYFIKDNLRVNVGYAFINHFPAPGFNTSRPEHRPWQQIWWNQKYPGVTMLQWLRLEQRFNGRVVNDVLEDGFNYTARVRYNIGFFIPLKGKEISPKTPFISIGNELFLSFGKRVVYNTYDQNRFFAGIGYQFTANVNLQAGYLNVFTQEASGNNYTSSHAVRVALFHNMDLR